MAIPLAVPIAIGAASIASNLYDNWKNRADARDMYNDIKDETAGAVGANQSDIDAYTRMMEGYYGDDAAKYSDALDKFLNSDVYQNEGFSYDRDIGEFVDPFVNQRVNAAMTAINNSASSGGNRFSSDYINRVGARQQSLASEAWQQAYDNLMKDRQMQLSEWQQNSQNNWNNYNANQDRAKYAVDAYGNARDQMAQAYGDATMAGMQNRMGGLQTQANVATARYQSQQGQNPLSQILGPAATFFGSYYGAKG